MREPKSAPLKTVTPLDCILIVLLLTAAILSVLVPPLIRPQGQVTAVITCNGAVFQEIALGRVAQPYQIELPTDPAATVTVEPGGICFSHAECPDQLCVHTGRLEKPGDTAACLPANAVITLIADPGGSGDLMTY